MSDPIKAPSSASVSGMRRQERTKDGGEETFGRAVRKLLVRLARVMTYGGSVPVLEALHDLDLTKHSLSVSIRRQPHLVPGCSRTAHHRGKRTWQ